MRATIEFLNELVDRFSAATKANRATPGRRGSVIELGPNDAEEVLVVGDLHGNRRNFNKVLKFADLDGHPKRHLVLQEVVHGGPAYEDGGDMSHMLLEDVAKLKVKYPARVHFLLSNHELSEVTKVSLHKGGALAESSLCRRHRDGLRPGRITHHRVLPRVHPVLSLGDSPQERRLHQPHASR